MCNSEGTTWAECYASAAELALRGNGARRTNMLMIIIRRTACDHLHDTVCGPGSFAPASPQPYTLLPLAYHLPQSYRARGRLVSRGMRRNGSAWRAMITAPRTPTRAAVQNDGVFVHAMAHTHNVRAQMWLEER